MGELSSAPRVPAECLHAGDEISVERDGVTVSGRIIYAIHGYDGVGNFVSVKVADRDGKEYGPWPYPSEKLIERTYANALAAA